jgi:hypothetical protein
MKLTAPILIALALFVAAPSYAQQLKPVSADARQVDRDALRDHIDKIFQAYIAKDAATIRATHALAHCNAPTKSASAWRSGRSGGTYCGWSWGRE